MRQGSPRAVFCPLGCTRRFGLVLMLAFAVGMGAASVAGLVLVSVGMVGFERRDMKR